MEGKFIQTIDVAAFTPLETFQRGVRATLNAIKKTPPALGVGDVFVPGEPEHRARTQRLVHGIELPDTVYRQICDQAQKLGVSLSESEVTDDDISAYLG